MIKNILLTDIIDFLSDDIITVYGNPDSIEVRYLRDPQNVDEFTLDWISPRRPDKQLVAEKSKAKALFIGQEIEYSNVLKEQGKVILFVDNPKLVVAKVGNEFFIEKIMPGIHPSAIIHPEAEIGNNVFIGPNTTVGKCKIGKNVTIHSNVIIYDNVTIKGNVLIHAGAIIGTDGLGCEREEDGRLVKFPHFGGVIIEDYVHVGANSCIDNGSLTPTIIKSGTKIDNLVHIGHNVEIGKNTVIAAQSGISGSTKVGENSMFGGQVGVVGHLKLGDFAKYAAQAGVSKKTKNNETVIGSPAMPKDQFIKSYIIFKKLPSIVKQIEKLEKKLYNLD